jgi:small nuclear ribonucleoprotein (snRNP)-like protein
MPDMDRRRSRPKRFRGREGRPAPRRVPPPDTGLEAKFYEEQRQAGAAVVVTLTDGTTVCGTIQEFDRGQITIEDSSGPIVIRKSEIRYLQVDA